ncbi:MAG TPA: N-acetylmuramoyl-L-alanine amidase, partial [Terriglobales bacterium]|nr:N-acetylmuramoyl-L-alanine amidase [Terriglobales bacterium]
MLTLLLVLLWPPAPQAQPAAPQRLSVYTSQSVFSIQLQDYGGRTYFGILDLLSPLGEISAQQDGDKWKGRFNGIEMEFREGKNRAKIKGKNLDLAAAFHLQDGKAWVPVASVAPLLSRVLQEPVELHEAARRLFVGGAAVHFTAQLVHFPADSVVLSFSAPVNPSIATEPGKLRMTFAREPVVHGNPTAISFPDKSISSLSYREADGVAEIAINSSVPLLARFSTDRKTITVGPVVQIVAQAKPQPATPPAAAPTPSPAAPVGTGQPPAVVAPPAPAAPPPLVVVDASHGGAERGAALSDTLAEKDVVLSIALRLHNDLEARGLRTALLRNSDSALS